MIIRSTVTKQSDMILHFFFLIALSICHSYIFLNLSIYRFVYAVCINSLPSYLLYKGVIG